MAALCGYPPTGRGSARCFGCEDRKYPGDFVRGVMVGLAMRGSSRKGGVQQKSAKDAVLQKGGRLLLSSI